MGWNRSNFFDRHLRRLRLKYWQSAAGRAPHMVSGELRKLRADARQIRREMDRILQVAELRLTQPFVGSDALRREPTADWAWRPNLWRVPVAPIGIVAAEDHAALDAETRIHHDGKTSEIALRQLRNTGAEDLSPFGLRIDVLAFGGSFVSLTIELPKEAARGLRLNQLVRLDLTVEAERPTQINARLNIRHGPNTEQLIVGLPSGDGEKTAEFDLAYTKLNERRVEQAWVDLFFDPPEMNQIILRDVAFSRRPRADL